MAVVTHHVEEVPEGFTHALLLRSGGIVAQGKVDEVFTQEHLSAAFGLPLAIDRQNGRWYARSAR
jgi:iron complex transport system ATP-binding protein